MLGYSDANQAIRQHCRYPSKQRVPHPQSVDKTIEMNFIPEGDLYRLIARSKLPAAEHCCACWEMLGFPPIRSRPRRYVPRAACLCSFPSAARDPLAARLVWVADVYPIKGEIGV